MYTYHFTADKARHNGWQQRPNIRQFSHFSPYLENGCSLQFYTIESSDKIIMFMFTYVYMHKECAHIGRYKREKCVYC